MGSSIGGPHAGSDGIDSRVDTPGPVAPHPAAAVGAAMFLFGGGRILNNFPGNTKHVKKEQARKLQDAQAEKLTSLQASKLTS